MAGLAQLGEDAGGRPVMMRMLVTHGAAAGGSHVVGTPLELAMMDHPRVRLRGRCRRWPLVGRVALPVVRRARRRQLFSSHFFLTSIPLPLGLALVDHVVHFTRVPKLLRPVPPLSSRLLLWVRAACAGKR